MLNFFFFCRFKNSVGICQGISSHYSMSDTFTLTCISNSFGWLFLAVVMATVSTAISTSRAQPPSYIFRLFLFYQRNEYLWHICIRSPSGPLCLLALLSTWLPSFCFCRCFCFSLWCFSLPTLTSLFPISNYSLLRLFKVSFSHIVHVSWAKWTFLYHQKNSTFSLVITLDHCHRRESKFHRNNWTAKWF